MHPIIIFVTTSNADEATKIAELLLNKKLVACVTLLDRARSMFLWENTIQQQDECWMMIKSTDKNFAKIEELILKNHSYSVPEILALSIANGNEKYLTWLRQSLEKSPL